MGTDIYMEWQGKTEADNDKQMEAILSVSGNVGYLRASIHMINENAVLRTVFPEKYWNERSKDEYDFKAGFEKLERLGIEYLQAVISGKEMEEPEGSNNLASGKQAAAAISQALAKAGWKLGGNEQIQVYCGKVEDFREAVEWLNEVFYFFEFGIRLQEKGLKPFPYISW